jgi:uncharacterized lipoprotein YddW (UPF0748 family)
MANDAVYWRIFVYDACVTYTALVIALAFFDCPPQFSFSLMNFLSSQQFNGKQTFVWVIGCLSFKDMIDHLCVLVPTSPRFLGRMFLLKCAVLLCLLGSIDSLFAIQREVRGTWLTTTANTAISNPENTEQSMRRIKEIGLNTVYVESWKNGYTQFPSKVLQRTLGVTQRPPYLLQDPSDVQQSQSTTSRNLLQETLIAAHRQGLIYVAWFEYGFMAAHKSTMNHLRIQKPAWLSRDRDGNEVASNGFVWLNPLHPEAQQFLLELVLEAVDVYDLDGIQLDDRIVWPDIRMGYDAYTTALYAQEHAGQSPPNNYLDPEWMQWRADKVTQFAQRFVQAVRAKRPGLIISLSPAVYPWSWQHHLLAWPQWSVWSTSTLKPKADWDEFIPQAYRFSYPDFAKTWQQQIDAMRVYGDSQAAKLVAGIRIVGDGRDSSWEQLRQSIELTRTNKNAGHVLWYSRGVLDLYPEQLRAFYQDSGAAISPHFPAGWRQVSIPLLKQSTTENAAKIERWQSPKMEVGRFQVIVHDQHGWRYLDQVVTISAANKGMVDVLVPAGCSRVELIVDRRQEMQELQR